MIYELVYYPDWEAFNKDAADRNEQVKKERTTLSYDRPWTVMSVGLMMDDRVKVLWQRMDTYKHGH